MIVMDSALSDFLVALKRCKMVIYQRDLRYALDWSLGPVGAVEWCRRRTTAGHTGIWAFDDTPLQSHAMSGVYAESLGLSEAQSDAIECAADHWMPDDCEATRGEGEWATAFRAVREYKHVVASSPLARVYDHMPRMWSAEHRRWVFRDPIGYLGV